MKVIVGITGASGSIYAVRLLKALKDLSIETDVIMSEMGRRVFDCECPGEYEKIRAQFEVYDNGDLFAPVASGSNLWQGMVILPCSVNTLGAAANGIGDTLLLRAASVTLKEGRKLIAVVRETPLSLINLENMCRLGRAGGCIMPASPGFYNRPADINSLADDFIARVLDQLGIEHTLGHRWKA